ncbi:unnamed protein product [Taenia asiatica]|uniref:Uncharacterized protein n=1 Tax=Taenia asiatica TaxID=60517 RepID=A0A0R3VVA9_TAEAS|nr:unnamed protein product [Taenia asiatica]
MATHECLLVVTAPHRSTYRQGTNLVVGRGGSRIVEGIQSQRCAHAAAGVWHRWPFSLPLFLLQMNEKVLHFVIHMQACAKKEEEEKEEKSLTTRNG